MVQLRANNKLSFSQAALLKSFEVDCDRQKRRCVDSSRGRFYLQPLSDHLASVSCKYIKYNLNFSSARGTLVKRRPILNKFLIGACLASSYI